VGDSAFQGVNNRLDPAQLPPGLVAGAKNKRWNRGVAETRKGMMKLRWANRIVSVAFTADASSDQITATAHGFRTADPVSVYSTGGLPGGLYNASIYFVRVIDANTLKLFQTAADATNNANPVDLTSAGSGTHTIRLERAEPYLVPYAAGEFNDLDKRKWIITAADSKVYRHAEDNAPVEIALPAGVTLAAPIFFVQGVSDLIMLRGRNLAPLKMSNVDTGFTAITKQANTITGAATENPSDGTAGMPNASLSLYMGNRLFVPVDDLVYVSDYLNVTRFQPVKSVFRIYQGIAGDITAAVKFDEATAIFAKERAIYRVGNLTGNLSQAFCDEVTREYGAKAARSFAQVGADVWFLADRRGVCSIRRTDEGKLQAVDLPVSDEIDDYIKRINWRYADKAVAAYHDNKYYLAVPWDNAEVLRSSLVPAETNYDGSGAYTLTVKQGRTYRWTKGSGDTSLVNGTDTLTTDGDFTAQGSSVTLNGTISAAITASVKPVFKGINNVVLVYDFLTKHWSGYDTCKGDDLAVLDWVKHTYNGTERLYCLGADGFTNLYEEGFEDELPDQFDVLSAQPVEDELLTRGYTFGSDDTKRFTDAAVVLSTWAPNFSITAQFGGVNETKALKSGITKSRTKYFKPWDKADWDPTNANDDHATPYREDYSVSLEESIVRSGSIVAGTTYLAERTDVSTTPVQYNSINYYTPLSFIGVTGQPGYTPTNAIVLGANGYIDPKTSGFDPDLHQEIIQPFRIGREAAYVQLKITNTQGRCAVRAVEVRARAGERDLSVKG
jgi:hypothetical protein